METNPSNSPKPKSRSVLRIVLIIIGSIALSATAYQLVMNTAFRANLHATSTVDHIVLPIVHTIAAVFFLMLVIRALRIMKWFDRFWRSLFTWRGARRALVAMAIFATLLAVVYAEENWRGKRAWDQCKAELEAKGEKLDWAHYLPAPISDDQNVFKSPKMADWFVRESWSANGGRSRSNELTGIFNSKPLVEFTQKIRSNVVAEISIVTPNQKTSENPSDLLLRYGAHALRLATTNDLSTSIGEIIEVIQFQDAPVSIALSNLARQAGINFVFDPAILSKWHAPHPNSLEPYISIKLENFSARSAFFSLLNAYNFAYIEDAKTGIGRVVSVPEESPTGSRPQVFVQWEAAEKLKDLIRVQFEHLPEVQIATNLSDVRLNKFSAHALPSLTPLRLSVISEEHLDEKVVKDFFPRNLPQTTLRGGSGWRVQAIGSNTFQVYLANEPYFSAADYLAWSDQFTPQFEIIRAGLTRPQAQMGGNYDAPFLMPVPDFVCVRNIAQHFAERAQCHLLLGQPAEALKDLTLIHDLHRFLIGKPMLLVSAMIDVAITGLYTSIIADGIRLNAWGDTELVTLQKQLAEVDLAPNVALALQTERAATTHTLLTMKPADVAKLFHSHEDHRSAFENITDPVYLLLKFAPRGWVYQNLVTGARIEQTTFLEAFDSRTKLFAPSKTATDDQLSKAVEHWGPFNVLARVAIPNFVRALKVTAHKQTMANESLIVCGLQQYHRTHSNYPETLDALIPQFLESIPRDIIGGQPLKYRRTDDGKFSLYSIGWNETDDNGKIAPNKNGQPDYDSADWVWQFTAH